MPPTASPEVWRFVLSMECCALWLSAEIARECAGQLLRPEVRRILAERASAELQRVLTARAQLVEIAHHANAAGIGITVLKGGSSVFSADAVDLGDLDLLVAPSDVARLDDLTRRLGYVSRGFDSPAAYYLAPRKRAESLQLEIHRRIDDRSMAGDPTARQAITGANGLLMLGPVDHAWHILAHATLAHLHRRGQLRDLIALRSALRRLTEGDRVELRQRITDRAPDAGSRRAMLDALSTAQGTSTADCFQIAAAMKYAIFGARRPLLEALFPKILHVASVAYLAPASFPRLCHDLLTDPVLERSRWSFGIQRHVPAIEPVLRVVRAPYRLALITAGMLLCGFTRLRLRSAVVTGALSAIVCLGCGSADATRPLTSALEITAAGRIERNGTISLVATRGDTTLPPTQVNYTAEPSGSVELHSDGTARLLETGQVSIIARASGDSDSLVLTVAAPPTLVFDLLVGGVRSIYRAALDGVGLVRLTTSNRDDLRPTTARDTVVFASYRDGNSELYAVPLAGGTAQRLTTTPANESSPTLSPVARRLAFTSNASGVDQLWIASADGTDAAPALPPSNDIHSAPRWSPDGSRIVFVSTTGSSPTLYVLTVATGAVAPLAAGPGPNVDPAWNGDGSTIVFYSARPDAPGIYQLSLTTGAAALLVAGADVGQPAFLSDGRVVFTTFDGSSTRLRWVDPAIPSILHDVTLEAGDGSAAHAVSP